MHQAHRGAPWWSPLAAVLLCSSVSQAFDGPASLLFSCRCCHVGRGYGDGSTPYAWLSSTVCFHGCPAFLHGHFPPQSPTSHPLDLSLHSQQQPSPWDCSTIPKIQLPAAAPSRGPASLSGVCMAVASTVWFSFHFGCHRSAVSLSALNVSPLTQTIALMWGLDPCFCSPTRQGRSSPNNTPVPPPPVPSSYRVLRGSIYSFPLVRCSCLLSAGVLHALLKCLKVYSWCIHEERCTPCPPTPLLSYSLKFIPFYGWAVLHCIYAPQLLYPFICQTALKNKGGLYRPTNPFGKIT